MGEGLNVCGFRMFLGGGNYVGVISGPSDVGSMCK